MERIEEKVDRIDARLEVVTEVVKDHSKRLSAVGSWVDRLEEAA